MKEKTEKPKILIVSGYHPEETFAVKVGEALFQYFSNLNIKVIRYAGKSDRGRSCRNLRRFIEKFDPAISPIILHSDVTLGIEAAIVYSAKSKKEKRRALKPLRDFCLQQGNEGNTVVFGRFLIHNAKYGLFDIELNSELRLQKAVSLVEKFSRHLISLYLERELKL